MAARHLLVASLLLAAVCASQAVAVPCVADTKVSNCIECKAEDTGRTTCYQCSYLTVPVWNETTWVLTKCKATTTNCTLAGPKDANCARCDSTYCTRCKPGFGLNTLGRCANVSLVSVCRSHSMNAGCSACNPDGTCNRCTNTSKLLLPVNAIWLDAGYPETQCNTSAELNKESRDIMNGVNAYIPANCSELDADFQCCACKPGFGPMLVANPLVPGRIKCVAVNARTPTKYPSGCLRSIGYMNYCTACSNNGTRCIAGKCTGSRAVDSAGQCSLNCKGFWGIACKTCTASACSVVEDWAVARRRR